MKRNTIIVFALMLLITSACSRDGQDQDGQSTTSDSAVTVHTGPDGAKTETRSFREGDLLRVSRRTNADGTRVVKVVFRDGREVELTDPVDIARAMEASAIEVQEAALRAWERTKNLLPDDEESQDDR